VINFSRVADLVRFIGKSWQGKADCHSNYGKQVVDFHSFFMSNDRFSLPTCREISLQSPVTAEPGAEGTPSVKGPIDDND
jgi:hypothetical protein